MSKLLMDRIFGHMADVVIHYAEDLMIATKGTCEKHLKVGELVLQQLANANLPKPEENQHCPEGNQILRNHLEKGTLLVPEAKLMEFENYPIPTTPKRTKSFVCAMSYL
jgi:hypothetical protein